MRPYLVLNIEIFLFVFRSVAWSLELKASLSQRGVSGEVRFAEQDNGTVLVTADIRVAEGAEGEYTWGIYQFPIDYRQVNFYGGMSALIYS